MPLKKIHFSFRHTSERKPVIFTLQLTGVKRNWTLHFTEKEKVAYDAHLNRYFLPRIAEGKMTLAIRSAKSVAELEALARRYDFCDDCDFAGLSPLSVKALLEAVAHTLYHYPLLRGHLGFLGSYRSLRLLLEGMADGTSEKRLGLLAIEARDQVGLDAFFLEETEDVFASKEISMAYSISYFDLFQAIVVDEDDFAEDKLLSLQATLVRDEANGFHPRGSTKLTAVVYHEIGHLLSVVADLPHNAEFQRFYQGLTPEEIREGLSEYATTDQSEFIAEAFSESASVYKPRPLALEVQRFLEKGAGHR